MTSQRLFGRLNSGEFSYCSGKMDNVKAGENTASGTGLLQLRKMDGSTEMDCCYSRYRLLAHYLALLCFLLTLAILLQTCYLLQITLSFQSQSTLKEAKLKDLTQKLDSLNQSYLLLFRKYPALNQYCSIANSTNNERECSSCPEGWESFGEKCYLYSQDRWDWSSSQYHCLSAGGNLAMVKNEEEQIFLWKRAKELSQGDSYWVGLRKGNPGKASQWVDNSPVANWFLDVFGDNDPKNVDTRELCAVLLPADSHKADWYATTCMNSLKSICEKTQGTLQ
ncbi:C-type lectin domain family 4 member E-like [Esox lucius]|uniref:C-type lectin domain family 4 member E-like n=1 Tax=Esox lucius TaxID=8010 RepID=UPI0014772D97|nr:C-type lectin domain family 4 member E-like [Esox lucius]